MVSCQIIVKLGYTIRKPKKYKIHFSPSDYRLCLKGKHKNKWTVFVEAWELGLKYLDYWMGYYPADFSRYLSHFIKHHWHVTSFDLSWETSTGRTSTKICTNIHVSRTVMHPRGFFCRTTTRFAFAVLNEMSKVLLVGLQQNFIQMFKSASGWIWINLVMIFHRVLSSG